MKKIIIYSVIVSLFSLLSLKYFSAPWILIFVYVIIFLLTLAFTTKNQRIKVVSFNILALPVALLLVESYYYFDPFKEKFIRTGTYVTKGYYDSNEFLGYAPKPDIQRTLKFMRNDEVIYDVTYTINANGLRSTPSSNSNSVQCVLFLGGSFTFGEGLNDNETLSYFIGKGFDENFRIFNFGFHGYGPHHMLSAIENGLVEKLTKECRQFYAIYSGIPGHIARTAGYSQWDTNGPEYVVDNEELIYKGHFSEALATRSSYFFNTLESQLEKSLLYNNIFHKMKYITNDDQMNTFITIIERSQYLLRNMNNTSRFIIVFWEKNNLSSDVDKNNSDDIIEKLSEKGFEYYLVGDILDRYKDDRQRYSNNPHDAHPNAEANKLIASYLIKKMKNKIKGVGKIKWIGDK